MASEKENKYELIIVGCGAAGLTASIYAARYKINALTIGFDFGLASTAYKICNYPGFSEISGIDLMQKIYKHALKEEAEILFDKVMEIKKKDSLFEVKTNSGIFYSEYLLLATGAGRRTLGLKNEKKFIGKGLSYCASCDATLYKDKIVGVVGGGNSALTSALLLAQHAKKVYIIYRREKFFRPEPKWIEAVEKNKKIKVIFNANVVELIGDKLLHAVKLSNGQTLKLSGLFAEIGSKPNNELAKQLNLKLDKSGYIVVDETKRTSEKKVYAAGDVTNNLFKQIVVAASDAAVAIRSIYHELEAKR
ncbi:MAG: FAD-dependent oxidoreductase [Candidatus Diapherotrites archaeon]|nr:FAD-dependent oxidoreductase [Candidatus Diapherotrites archaeon]